jgi:hypothetical protein
MPLNLPMPMPRRYVKGSPHDYLARSSTAHLGVPTLERPGCRAGTPKQILSAYDRGGHKVASRTGQRTVA